MSGTPDLFGDRPALLSNSLGRARRPAPPELRRAKALCRHLKRERDPAAKRRTAHLICENLKALLNGGARP